MKKEVIAIFVMLLIISSPVSAALGVLIGSENDPNNLGEAMIIEVDHVDPTPLRSDYFQNREFDAYVFLKGKTVGTMLFGDKAPEQAPFYGGMKIRSIDFVPDAQASKYISKISFEKPKNRELIIDSNGNIDLGYAKVTLRRMSVEDDLPDTIDAEVKAIIWFDVMSGIGEYGAMTFNLGVSADEQAWLNSNTEESKFWGGRGYLRIKDIKDNSVVVDIYDGMKRRVDTKTLVLNGDIQQANLPGAATFVENYVTLKLDEINKGSDFARLIIEDTNKKVILGNYIKGMSLPNSDWKVDQIYKDRVSFVNSDGDKKSLELKKDKVDTDPCLNVQDISDSDIENAKYNQMYCHAIKELEKSIESTTDNNIMFDSNIKIAEIYDSMSAYSLSLVYYEKAQQIDPTKFSQNYNEVVSMIQQKAEASSATIDLSDNKVSALATSVGTSKQDSIIYVMDGVEKKIELGQAILTGAKDENDNSYSWIVKNIDSDNVVLEQKFESNVGLKKETVTLKVGQNEYIPYSGYTTKSVQIKEVIISRSAVITVSPGSKYNYGVSNFIIHLPIEKRLWDWTPEEIDKMIESTDKTISKVNTIKDKLGNIVKTWKGMCFAVFSFLAVKNAFFSNPGRRLAVQKWETKCDNAVKTSTPFNGKTYSATDFDKCMSDNIKQIEQDVERSKGMVDQTEEIMKGFDWNKEESVSKAASELGVSKEDLILMNKYDQLSAEGVRDSIFNKKFGEGFDSNEFNARISKAKEIDSVVRSENLDINNPEHYGQIERIKDYVYQETVTQQGNDLFSTQDEIARQEIGTKEVKYIKLENGEKVAYEVYEENGKFYVYDGKKIEVKQIKRGDVAVESSYGGCFETVESSNKVYLGTLSNEQYSSQFSIAPKIIYSQKTSKPLLIPLNKRSISSSYRDIPHIDGANYIMVNPTSKGNEYSIWNVGSDGKMDVNGHVDDLPVVSSDLLNSPINEKYIALKKEIENRYERANVAPREGSKVKMGTNEEYVAGTFVESRTSSAIGECRYIMSETDCKILFGVCDPVMCPTSRFNLGGSWEVDNVIKSGLVGSIVLGLPNFDIPYEPVPVCLTGVHASLENFASMLGGFRDCLETAKIKGESVGICNEIRSLYMCDMLWETALSMVNVFGKLNDLISVKIFGKEKGGGEYLSWDSSWDQLSKSVSFFTKDYASSAFTAFESRSTKEIGTEICKAAIFGKYPAGGDLLAQLTEPESPPQFTGWVEEDRYTLEDGGRSSYRIYYHIYAGRNTDIRYRVVLKDLTGRILSVTDENSIIAAGERLLRKGESVDKSFVVTPTASGMVGFTNMCIIINGDEECGFGSVSSSFSMQYLKDQIIQSQIGEIKSAKDCKPRSSVFMPGFTQSGLDMRCSVYDPDGVGDDWVYTGTCGYDEKDRPLGDCYLYKKGINLYDSSYNVTQNLPEQDKQEKTTFSTEEVDQKKTELNNLIDKDDKTTSLNERLQILSQYRQFVNSQISYETTALGYYRIGLLYYKIGKEKFIKQVEYEEAHSEEISFGECTITYDGDVSTSKNDIVDLRYVDGAWAVKVIGYGSLVVANDNRSFRLDQTSNCDVLNVEHGDEMVYELCKNLVGKGYQDGLSIIVQTANSQTDDTVKVVKSDGQEYKPSHGQATELEILELCVGYQKAKSILESEGKSELVTNLGKTVEIKCESKNESFKLKLIGSKLFDENNKEILTLDWVASILGKCGDFVNIEVSHEDGNEYFAYSTQLKKYDINTEEWLKNAVLKSVVDNHYPFEVKLNRKGGLFGTKDYTFIWNGFELEKISGNRDNLYNNADWNEFLKILIDFVKQYTPESIEFKCVGQDQKISLDLDSVNIIPYSDKYTYLEAWIEKNSASCGGFSITGEISSLLPYINYAKSNSVNGRKCNCGSNCERYAAWILKYANEYGINPVLALALIMQESSCDQTSSVSKAGAVGLMQITKTTFNDICNSMGNFDVVKGSSNAENNIACGMKILKAKYDLAKSSTSESLTRNNCDGDYYSIYGERYSSYNDWDAALRGYNGWGCNPKSADVNYVEEINNRAEILMDKV